MTSVRLADTVQLVSAVQFRSFLDKDKSLLLVGGRTQFERYGILASSRSALAITRQPVLLLVNTPGQKAICGFPHSSIGDVRVRKGFLSTSFSFDRIARRSNSRPFAEKGKLYAT